MLQIRSLHLCRTHILAIAIAFAGAEIHQVSSAVAGPWPERNVRVVTAGPPGSSVDLVARLFADRLAERWGKPLVVDNRAGADGILAVQAFVQGDDGHSLLFAFPGVVTVLPLLHDRLSFDPVSDLVPISSTANDFLSVAVSTKLPASTLSDFVRFAKSRPGGLNWAAAPGAPYLTFLEFLQRTGLAMTYVSYRGAAQAMPDLLADQIQLAVTPLASALPLAHDGRIKLLAVTAPERSVSAPDLMTAIEAGYPELTVEAPLGFFGPKMMPINLRNRIAADVAAIANDPAIAKRLSDIGMVVRTSTPFEYAMILASQRARWTELARVFGVRPQP